MTEHTPRPARKLTPARLDPSRYPDQLATLASRIKRGTWAVRCDHSTYFQGRRRCRRRETERRLVSIRAYLDAYVVMTNYGASDEREYLEQLVHRAEQQVAEMQQTKYREGVRQ